MTDDIVIYTSDDGKTRVEVRFTGADVLMTQAQMATLYGVTKQQISDHLLNIFSDQELSAHDTVRELLTVQVEGSTNVERNIKHYTLDAILSVGYRVRSKPATRFRQWATRVLIEFAVKGFVIDVERLKDADAPDYFQELLEKIRDIRASEKNVWKHILSLTTLCADYDDAGQARFYETFQNDVHWAVVQMTAAELMDQRVDARQPYCGVRQFKGAEPTVAEALIGKNYYSEVELAELNLLTTRLLDYFEDQSKRKKVVTLADFDTKLKEFIKFDERPVLRHKGRVTMAAAKAKASKEMKAYKARLRALKEAKGADAINALAASAKAITPKRAPRRRA
jgi:hypothetical protein